MARFRIAFGVAITIVWIGMSALYLHGTWPAAARFESSTIKEWAGLHGPTLTLLWLVLGYLWMAIGYLQNAATIRQNALIANEALKNASSALQIIETESHKQRHYQLSHIRAAQPRWEISGCLAHADQLEINLRNTGAAASDLSIWKKDLPLVAMLSNATFVDRGEGLTIKIVFTTGPLEKFALTLEYCDAAGAQRTAKIEASAVGATIRQEEI